MQKSMNRRQRAANRVFQESHKGKGICPEWQWRFAPPEIPPYHQWFREARLGLFIHWGLYALLGRGEWAMYHDRMPLDEYARLARKFNPKGFRVESWIRLAKAAGMRYAVLTTRHHDGFCLFDSAVSDFTSVKTAARRDFVAEFVTACRRHGLRVGLYYSLGDWRYQLPKLRETPAGARAAVAQVHAQVRELLTRYGAIDVLWYDGGWCYPSLPTDGQAEVRRYWQADRLNAMVRRLQPHILVNDRAGKAEDFASSEGVVAPTAGRMWEACLSAGRYGWGYDRYEKVRRPLADIMTNLATAVAGGGNLLWNIGPRPSGEVSAYERSILGAMGNWVKRHAEAVYGSGPCPYINRGVGPFAAKGSTVYWFMCHWPGRTAVVPNIANRVIRASLLTTGQRLRTERTPDGRTIFHGLPAESPDPCVTVMKMEVAGPPRPTEDVWY